MMSRPPENMHDTTKEDYLVLQVVPPRTASSRDMAALETVMQGLALDTRQPVALEIARTENGRQFLLRANSRAALAHLAAQIQARYPQAKIQPPAHDPLILRQGEIVTAVALGPGAASYLPLRAFRERELPTEGTDPLLGLLAAMSHVPAHIRIVTQLALLQLPPTWSQAARRRSVEHPLEPERQRQRKEMTTSGSGTPGAGAIIAMGILVAFLFLVPLLTHVASLDTTSRDILATWEGPATLLVPDDRVDWWGIRYWFTHTNTCIGYALGSSAYGSNLHL